MADQLPAFEDTVPMPQQEEQLPKFEDTVPVPEQNAAPSEDLPKFEDTIPLDEALPKFEDTKPIEDYQTAGQKAATVAEGLAGPIGTAFETSSMPSEGVQNALMGNRWGQMYLGFKKLIGEISPGDIEGRKQANPGLAGASEAVGQIGALSMMPELSAGENATKLAKIGASALNGMAQFGAMQSSDEIEKAMLGQGDPEHPVSTALLHVGAAGLLGGFTFGSGKAASLEASKGLKYLENNKYGTKVKDILAGMGHELGSMSSGMPTEEKALAQMAMVPENVNPSDFKYGQQVAKTMLGVGLKKMARQAAAGVGGALGGIPGALAGPLLERIGEKVLGKTVEKPAKKLIGQMLIKAADSGTVNNASQIIDYANSIAAGQKAAGKAVKNVMTEGFQKAFDAVADEKKREKLKKMIEEGGINQQIQDDQAQPQNPMGYAKGGVIVPPLQEQNEIANHWPEQNILLNSAKARISNYLNSVRPISPLGKLPFEKERKDKNKEREYDKVLDLANQPLSILNKVKEGTLSPNDMKHFVGLYPELHRHLSKKLTEEIAQKHLDEGPKPSYKKRQALSLFMGTNLDSSLTPQAMQAAQMVFVNQNVAKNQNLTKAAPLSKLAKHTETAEQARTQALNKD